VKHRGGVWLALAVILLIAGLLMRQGLLVLVASLLILVEALA